VDPVLRNLQAATAHANNIVASLDNPETLSSLRQTAANAAELTAKLDAVGGDVETLTSDPAFMDGLRNVTIGLGALFSEVYPAKMNP
jgi:phospholipid/cholesterol/gamma-HCH transport system substrate-binding protein